MVIERFSIYLASKPRRAAQLVLTLVIALIVTTAGMIAVIIDSGMLSKPPSEPPYPSEVTPLSLVEDGVVWTRECNMTLGGSETIYPFFRCCWQFAPSNGSMRTAGNLVNEEDLPELNMSVSAVVQTPFIGRIPWYDATNLTISLSIHEMTGDGIFSTGDYIVIDDAPRTEGIVYTWALAWVEAVTQIQEYSYAFHDGEFYSWRSSVLPTDSPWYDF